MVLVLDSVLCPTLECVEAAPCEAGSHIRVVIGVSSGATVDVTGQIVGQLLSEHFARRFVEERNGSANLAVDAFYDALRNDFADNAAFIAAIGAPLRDEGGSAGTSSHRELRGVMGQIKMVTWIFQGLASAHRNRTTDSVLVRFDNLPGAIEFIARENSLTSNGLLHSGVGAEPALADEVSGYYGFGYSDMHLADILKALRKLVRSPGDVRISIWSPGHV
jgi:hypothetical protein